MSSNFTKTWFMVPYHIRKLPGMTLALLDFYETIFEFWNNGAQCVLKNETIMERTGIKSISTIQEAFQYFEKHNVMKRVVKGRQRFIVQVLNVKTDSDDLEKDEPVDNSENNSSKSDQGIAPAIGRYRPSDRQGIAPAIHNNNNINNNNINKSKGKYDQKQNKAVYKSEYQRTGQTNDVKSTVKFWEPGNPDYDRLNGTHV